MGFSHMKYQAKITNRSCVEYKKIKSAVAITQRAGKYRTIFKVEANKVKDRDVISGSTFNIKPAGLRTVRIANLKLKLTQFNPINQRRPVF